MSDRLNEALNEPAVQSSWPVVDSALRRLVVDLTAHEIGAWSLLRHFHERALPELADLVNGERVEPDFEAAFQVMSGDVADQLTEDEIREGRELVAEAVRAAIGDRLLIDPPKPS